MARGTLQKKEAVKKKQENLTAIQRFGLFFYERRELTLLYLVALLVFGLLSYTVFMQRQGFPGVDVPVSTVTGTYFVNDRDKVDADVTRPLSEAIGDLPEVETVTAQAGDNFFVIITQYREGVHSQAGNDLIRREIEDRNLLPETAQAEFKPINTTKFADEYDILISVHKDESADAEELAASAQPVADQLQGREGVERATVLKQVESGTDPQTGRNVTQQRNFDRLGVREGSATRFYPSATIGIVGKTDEDTLELSDDVHQALEEIRSLPGNEDVRFVVSADFAEDIREQISGLQRSLLEGLAAVILVCFLLISWRASLTAAASMLTVILITLGILYLSGNTLNTITLFALILSLGLIVDDTIIMTEAIDAAKRESRRKREIVALAIKRVALASTAGTFTTMLAFAPMLFIGGILGEFIRVLPITVIISLAVSLLVSIALVPFFASGIILRRQPRPSRNPILKLESLISGGLARLVLVTKRSRAKGTLIALAAFSVAIVMVGAGLMYFQRLQFNIFPTSKDGNALQITLAFPQNTDIKQAQDVAGDVDKRVDKVLGTNLERLSYRNTGSATNAEIQIDLISFKDREVTSPQLVERLGQEFEGYKQARVQVSQIDVGPPEEELPFKLQVHSEDEAEATELAEDIVAFLNERTIERQNGTAARVMRVEIVNPSQVTRVDGGKIVEVGAGFDAEDTSALVIVARDAVEAEFPSERVAGYGLNEDALRFDFGAETENQESFSTLLIAFPVLLVAMYLLMALQFRSFLQPLLIFIAIPFSFFGVALSLYLSDNPLSFFVMIGFFALIGIAVNNTILLTDYANQGRREGMGRADAVAYAIKARFRPLITTSLTSVVALIPLALSDPFWETLSFTLIFGLLSSTFLVVLVFPYIYLAGEVLRVFGHELWFRELPKVVQYPLDVLIAPVRLVAYLLHIIFRHKPA